MTLKATLASKNAALNGTGLKEQFDLGFLFIYSGPLPATAEEALDMVTLHTELVIISNNGGVTGLTFDAPTAGELAKAAAETWKGTCTFDGADDVETTLTPAFYRFCAAGDDGRGVANGTTGYRIQGTVGGPASAADLRLGVNSLTAANEQPIGAFGWSIG